jgi:galactokinase
MSARPAHAARLRRKLFEAWGPSEDRVFVARAPGRVNLIGEHTDYNQGLVLPAAIGLEVSIAFRPRTDLRVELHSPALDETRSFDLSDVERLRSADRANPTWLDYVVGTAWALSEAGMRLRGLQGVIGSTLPIGGGLASSAALELASAWALLAPGQRPQASPRRLAALAHRAEEEFVGVRSGVMDQLAVSCGQAGHALLIDCRSMEIDLVPLPEGVAVVVCDSGLPRRLSDSAYNERRAQCEEGVRLLRERLPWVESLRDVQLETFEHVKAHLPRVIAQRCEHVIRENERVRAVASSLRSGRLKQIEPLFAESHASLRDRYEVSTPELDALVQIAAGTEGIIGARLTGAGFGGCTVNLVESEAAEAFRDSVARRYTERTGRAAAIHVVETVEGADLTEA